MKEYRLAAWPDLEAPYHRTAYRRMLSDMSQRHVSLARLSATSGLARAEVRHFIEMLESHGLVRERDGVEEDSFFGTLGPLGGWIRRTFTTHA